MTISDKYPFTNEPENMFLVPKSMPYPNSRHELSDQVTQGSIEAIGVLAVQSIQIIDHIKFKGEQS